jgi:hypothetical protein
MFAPGPSHPRIECFGPNCGSDLYRLDDSGSDIGIRLGSIDQRAALSPARQIWCRSAPLWSRGIEKLPQRSKE